MRRLIFPILAAAIGFAVSPATVRAADQAIPTVGDVATGFTLLSQDGTPISLNSFHGKWVVLYFYPKDMTSGCTIEAHNFQRDLAKFEARNAVILGVSVDTADSHKQFCTKEGLTFRLLADPGHKVVEAYGSLGGFMGIKIANRNTFLIDPHGKIARVWTKVEVQHHSEDVLAAIPELKK
jgi:peroxiredoxin Q/BCP